MYIISVRIEEHYLHDGAERHGGEGELVVVLVVGGVVDDVAVVEGHQGLGGEVHEQSEKY